MKTQTRSIPRRREGGQTIIVAMIVLGLLLILGLVFIGIINRNIQTSGKMQDRSVAGDLSEAGIRFAHNQMIRSELGADWRGAPTPPIDPDGDGLSNDPDAFYLREPGVIGGTTRARFLPGPNSPLDQGGPDGLGPYFRVNYSQGRSLVRVRYAPSDANLFRATPLGALRSPGLARNYIIIESVGREGKVNVNDPTTLTSSTQFRVQGYGSQAEFLEAINTLRAAESKVGTSAVNRAFASIGIVEHARFITNKFRNSRPAEIGIPAELGARDRNGDPIASVGAALERRLPYQVGSALNLIDPDSSLTVGPFAGGGSMYVNADLKLYGETELFLNSTFGDQLSVSGTISTDENAALRLYVTRLQGGNWSQTTEELAGGAINSFSPQFGEGNGLIRDGLQELDRNNRPRSIGYKAPPSILTRDPQTGATRYVQMSRDSGAQVNGSNNGELGYGRNVYVNNGSRRQSALGTASDANGETSLVTEWLTPGGDPSNTGWRGWLYTPPGAYMELQSDGFTIQRDGSGDEAIWRLPNGALSGSNFIRYRLGRGTDGRLHAVNTFTFTGDSNRINGNLTTADYDQGPEFGGVVYFEGNVRVRGVIPTDVQLTVVSNATVYIEGSITKGVVGNQFTSTYPAGATAVGSRLTRLSRSLLMLMAKDYVTLNTTQFFGTSRGQNVIPKEDVAAIGAFNPIVMRASDPNGLRLNADFVLDPNSTANPADSRNPNTWRPYALGYGQTSNLLLTHTMDNGAAPASFFTLDVNADFGNSAYRFPQSDSTLSVPFTNLASEYVPGALIPLYGLGADNFERYNQFESLALPLVDPNQVTIDVSTNSFVSTAPFGGYRMTQTGLNDLRFRPTSVGGLAINDYLVGRTAITPHDIRIEASIYAEEGSFFIIPGPWFNPNPNDTAADWNSPADGGGSLSNDERNVRRLQRWGSYPEMPFYGEPLDVRINIIGAVSEDMPVPMSVQSEWIRKWGWIPREHGSSGTSIPAKHVAAGSDPDLQFVPNLTITYDPVLATGRVNGFEDSRDPDNPNAGVIRLDEFGRPLPPLPRLPVSPTLAFFGEVR